MKINRLNKLSAIFINTILLLVFLTQVAFADPSTTGHNPLINPPVTEFPPGTIFHIFVPTNPEGTGPPNNGPRDPSYGPIPHRVGPKGIDGEYTTRPPCYSNGQPVDYRNLLHNNGGHNTLYLVNGAGNGIAGTFTIGPGGNPILVSTTSNTNSAINPGRTLTPEREAYLKSQLPKGGGRGRGGRWGGKLGLLFFLNDIRTEGFPMACFYFGANLLNPMGGAIDTGPTLLPDGPLWPPAPPGPPRPPPLPEDWDPTQGFPSPQPDPEYPIWGVDPVYPFDPSGGLHPWEPNNIITIPYR